MKTSIQLKDNKEATTSQIYNPLTGHYIKRDTISGQILAVRSDGKRFKGIRQELPIVRMNGIIVPKNIARKAERAVIKVINERLSKA